VEVAIAKYNFIGISVYVKRVVAFKFSIPFINARVPKKISFADSTFAFKGFDSLHLFCPFTLEIVVEFLLVLVSFLLLSV